MLAMLLGKPGQWHTANAPVGPNLVVVEPPYRDLFARLVQRLEPVLVQALVAEPTVEVLNVAVLHRLSWLDRVDAVALCPTQSRLLTPAYR